VTPLPLAGDSQAGRILVWDAAVRLLHWLLAGLVLFDYFIDDEGGCRIARSATSPSASSSRACSGPAWRGANGFAALRPSLHEDPRLLVATARRAAWPTIRSACGWCGCSGRWCSLLGLTGWMTRLDAFWGDETLHDVHAWLAHALIAAVAVHLAGVAR
jgi:hypothetical protein